MAPALLRCLCILELPQMQRIDRALASLAKIFAVPRAKLAELLDRS